MKMARRKHLRVNCNSTSSSSSSSSCDNSCVPQGCNRGCPQDKCKCKRSSSSDTCEESCSGYKGLSSIPCSSGSSSSSSECDEYDYEYLCKPQKEKCHKVEHCDKKPRKQHKKKTHKKKCKNGCDCDCDCDVADQVCPIVRDGCESSSSSCSSSSTCSSAVSIIVPDLGCEYGRKCEWTDKVEKDCCDSSSDDCDKKHRRKDGAKCSKCAYPHKHCKCHKIKGRSFEVSYVNKEGHPWQHRITTISSCIAIDGKKGPDVHLTRGHVYQFIINPEGLLADQDFYFTHDVQGGPIGQCADSPTYDPIKLPGTPEPVASGMMILKADWNLPKTFYYQSKMNRCCGGRVFIHDK